VYNVDGVEFIVEEGTEDDHAGTEGFWAWHQSGSWQSSWQANRKKEQRKQAQQQQEQQSRRKQQQRRQPKSEREELMDVLAQLDADTIAGLQQVFGPRLQDLQSKEELLDFLGAVNDLMDEDGVEFDMFSAVDSAWESPAASRSRRSGRSNSNNTGSSSRSRRASSRASSSRSAGASSRRQSRGRSREDEEVVEVPFSAFTGGFPGGTVYSFGDLEGLLEVIDLDDIGEVAWSEDGVEEAVFRESSRRSSGRGGVYAGGVEHQHGIFFID